MKYTPAALFIFCVVVANILAFIYVDRQGGAEALFSQTHSFAVCLAWIAVNLLCFFLYTRLRRK